MSDDTHELDSNNSSVNAETKDDTGGNDVPENTGKNNSNFKKLYKKAKAQEKLISELREQIKAKEDKDMDFEDDDDSSDETIQDSGDIQTVRLEIFGLNNPEAKSKLKEIASLSKKHNMNYESAWKYLQATTPKESTTKNDFVVRGKGQSGDIDYKSISIEETSELSSKERAEWRKANGWSI